MRAKPRHSSTNESGPGLLSIYCIIAAPGGEIQLIFTVVAEMGGELGLFIGVSFLSVWDLGEFIFDKYKQYTK